MKGYKILKHITTELGNKIELISTNFSTFQPFNISNILVIGVFHGDEPQGKFLIEEYLKHKGAYPPFECYAHNCVNIYEPNSYPPLEGKNVLFIPCLNPDGMALGTRTNANGVDINRNFPTKNWGEDTSQAGDNPSDYFGGKSAGSEIETQFVMEVIEEYKPEKILTLHAPYKVVNYDGPAKDWAESISKIIGYPVEESIGYPTPGSFGTYAGIERNIPVITLELDEEIPPEQLIPPVFEIFNEL